MEPGLALQKAVVARLKGDAGVTALAGTISDRHGLPEAFPSILIGEGQTMPARLTLERRHHDVALTLHLWSRDSSLVEARQMAGAVHGALALPFYNVDGHRVVDAQVTDTRFMHDPGRHQRARCPDDRSDLGGAVMRAGRLDRVITIQRATATGGRIWPRDPLLDRPGDGARRPGAGIHVRVSGRLWRLA